MSDIHLKYQRTRLIATIGSFGRPSWKSKIVSSTIVAGTASIRERQPGEPIHLKFDLNMPCIFCEDKQETFGCWTDDADLWNRHPERCNLLVR